MWIVSSLPVAFAPNFAGGRTSALISNTTRWSGWLLRLKQHTYQKRSHTLFWTKVTLGSCTKSTERAREDAPEVIVCANHCDRHKTSLVRDKISTTMRGNE
jgi:hypothetical protein